MGCSVMRYGNVAAGSGIVSAEVKQTRAQPGPGKKDCASWKLTAVREGERMALDDATSDTKSTCRSQRPDPALSATVKGRMLPAIQLA